MKSFADWTDEIRALMNPPAPMADTCNYEDLSYYDKNNILNWDTSAVDIGTAIHTAWEVQAKRWPKVDPKWLEWADTRAVEFRKELLGEFKPEGADTTGTAMAQRQRDKMDRLGLVYGCGRRTGKSVMQGEWFKRAMEFLASQDYSKLEERVVVHGAAYWESCFTGKGDGPMMVIHDEIHSNEAARTPNADGYVYLMAPSYEHARLYARDNGLFKRWKYIHRADQMHGMRDCKILAVGSWSLNKTREIVMDMEEYMRSHEIEVVYV